MRTVIFAVVVLCCGVATGQTPFWQQPVFWPASDGGMEPGAFNMQDRAILPDGSAGPLIWPETHRTASEISDYQSLWAASWIATHPPVIVAPAVSQAKIGGADGCTWYDVHTGLLHSRP